MIRVVIDTGVVVSAAFRDRTPEELILFVAGKQGLRMDGLHEIIDEYDEVLARPKFGLIEEILAEWHQALQTFTTLIETDSKIDLPRDPKDAKFLECAVASDAKYLITGDSDFEEAPKLPETTIISVSEFKRLVMQGTQEA